MGLLDILIGPILLLLILILAYLIRPFVTNYATQKYFIPALLLKIIGAISLGFIYQFYYGGGDTFGFTTHGSSWIFKSLFDSPIKTLRLLTADGGFDSSIYEYYSQIWYYGDSSSYFIVRIAAMVSFVTLDSYVGIAIGFAVISFSGLWAMYLSFNKLQPGFEKAFALSCFFIPSLIFWGSGVLKDTITLGALGWLTWAVINIQLKKRWIVSLITVAFMVFIIASIKIYILLCYSLALAVWIFLLKIKAIRALALRLALTPFILVLFGMASLLIISLIGEYNDKYDISNLQSTAEITAKDNSLWTVRQGGSAYAFSNYDYGVSGILAKFFPAINVTLFRPYLWEINSPIMLLSAFESTLVFISTLFLLFRSSSNGTLFSKLKNPFIIFCLTFSILFAFSVGISAGNFGSLVRYKIPYIPFYFVGLILLSSKSNEYRKI